MVFIDQGYPTQRVFKLLVLSMLVEVNAREVCSQHAVIIELTAKLVKTCKVRALLKSQCDTQEAPADARRLIAENQLPDIIKLLLFVDILSELARRRRPRSFGKVIMQAIFLAVVDDQGLNRISTTLKLGRQIIDQGRC